MCLAENMRIQMADGSTREMNAVKIGDWILDEQHGSVLVTNVLSGMEEYIYCIKLNNHSALKATKEHPVLTENGFKRMMDLKAGDMVQGAYGPQTVQSIEKEKYESVVYNLLLDSESHSMICEGIIVGDFSAQQTLSR
jgi:intein/homing endonuclease